MQKLANVFKVNCRPFSSARHQKHPNLLSSECLSVLLPLGFPRSSSILWCRVWAAERGKYREIKQVQGPTVQTGKVLKWTELEADLTFPR